MHLTKHQRRALIRAKELRGKPFPVLGSMLRSSKRYLLFGAVIGVYSAWTWSMGAEEASIASVAFLVGMIARDIAWLRLHARMWPVNVEITDWARVDALLNNQSET